MIRAELLYKNSNFTLIIKTVFFLFSVLFEGNAYLFAVVKTPRILDKL